MPERRITTRQRTSVTSAGLSNEPQEGHHADITVEEISSSDEFYALMPIWDDLLAQSVRHEIYMTHEWMSTWWRCFQDAGRQLLILLIREETTLIGIAPLMLTHTHPFGLRVRKVEFLSTMRFADSPMNCAATLDFIALPDRSVEVLRAVLTYLHGRESDWDILRFHPVPESSATSALIPALAEEFSYTSYRTVINENAYIYTGVPWEKYRRSLSRNFKKQLRMQERKLAEFGQIGYEIISTSDEVNRAFGEIMEIERQSWKWNVGVSINSIAYRNFYQEFAKLAGKKGWLNLWLMHLSGKNISYEYAVNCNGQVELLKGSFDHRYRQYSPGNHLALKEYETYFGSTRRIGLLWGETDGKKRWHPILEPHMEIFVFNKTVYTRTLGFCVKRLHICVGYRFLIDIWHRFARKLHLRLRCSELTREDQLRR